MLVKSSNVQQKHRLIVLTISLFFLVLLIYPINVRATTNVQPEYIDAAGETKIVNTSDVYYSANSKIFVGRTYWDFGWDPDGRLRWYLYSPGGDIVYYQEADWHETDEAEDIGYVNDPEIVVPWLPGQGLWKLILCIRGPILGVIEKTMFAYYFSVGESSFADNIMAPICLTWGGILHVGEFSAALPGVFWLTSPLWIIAIIFILLAFYFRSFRLAAGLIKESVIRFKAAITKKS